MTLFNSRFQVYEIARANSGYDASGDPIAGAVTSRYVRGTIQPLNARELSAMAEGGDRQTGTVKIYSAEKLPIRSQDSEARAYVKSAAGVWYELTGESANQNGIISHYKYTAAEVPLAQVPEVLK